MAAGTEIVTQKQAMRTLSDMLDRAKPKLLMALPKHMSVDRLLRISLTSVYRTPDLAKCDPASFLSAVMQSAQLGLEPDGTLGHAYLIPYRNNKKGIMEVQLIPGYKGLMDLARRSGNVLSIQAHVIHEKDIFDFEFGLSPKLRHVPTREEDPGPMIGVYAVAHLRDADPQFDVMWKRQVDAIRARSRSGNSGPWLTDYEEMARKTILRRLCKVLPASVELATAVALDERAEAGIPQELEFDGIVETPTGADNGGAGAKTALGSLTEKMSKEEAARAVESAPPAEEPPAEEPMTVPTPEDGMEGEMVAVMTRVAQLLSEPWAKKTKVVRPTATGSVTAVTEELKPLFPDKAYVTVNDVTSLDQALGFRDWLLEQKAKAEGASSQ